MSQGGGPGDRSGEAGGPGLPHLRVWFGEGTQLCEGIRREAMS